MDILKSPSLKAMNQSGSNTWKVAFNNPDFRKKFYIGLALFISVLSVLPFFFQYIQQRSGSVLNDIILKMLTPRDVSLPIVTIIYGMGIFMLVRCLQNPKMLLLFIYSLSIVFISRLGTIYITQWDAPVGLIPLTDPISNAFYGKDFITKDLFYSGHTAAQFLIFLCLQKKWDKILALCCSVSIGILVLIQHIHYSVDVVFAPVFTMGCYLIAKKIVFS